MLVSRYLPRKMLTSSYLIFEGSRIWVRTAFFPVLVVSTFNFSTLGVSNFLSWDWGHTNPTYENFASAKGKGCNCGRKCGCCWCNLMHLGDYHFNMLQLLRVERVRRLSTSGLYRCWSVGIWYPKVQFSSCLFNPIFRKQDGQKNYFYCCLFLCPASLDYPYPRPFHYCQESSLKLFGRKTILLLIKLII